MNTRISIFLAIHAVSLLLIGEILAIPHVAFLTFLVIYSIANRRGKILIQTFIVAYTLYLSLQVIIPVKFLAQGITMRPLDKCTVTMLIILVIIYCIGAHILAYIFNKLFQIRKRIGLL